MDLLQLPSDVRPLIVPTDAVASGCLALTCRTLWSELWPINQAKARELFREECGVHLGAVKWSEKGGRYVSQNVVDSVQVTIDGFVVDGRVEVDTFDLQRKIVPRWHPKTHALRTLAPVDLRVSSGMETDPLDIVQTCFVELRMENTAHMCLFAIGYFNVDVDLLMNMFPSGRFDTFFVNVHWTRYEAAF